MEKEWRKNGESHEIGRVKPADREKPWRKHIETI